MFCGWFLLIMDIYALNQPRALSAMCSINHVLYQASMRKNALRNYAVTQGIFINLYVS